MIAKITFSAYGEKFIYNGDVSDVDKFLPNLIKIKQVYQDSRYIYEIEDDQKRTYKVELITMEDIDLRAKELRLESEVKRLNKQVDEKDSKISKYYTEKVNLQEALKVSQVFRPDFEM